MYLSFLDDPMKPDVKFLKQPKYDSYDWNMTDDVDRNRLGSSSKYLSILSKNSAN